MLWNLLIGNKNQLLLSNLERGYKGRGGRVDLEPLWMIYCAETAFIFCLVQLLNAKLASSVWHVWQTPLWSVHPTGRKRPAGSANSSQHYLLLILIPCTGICWHPWERWTCTRRGRLGRRAQGAGRWGAWKQLSPSIQVASSSSHILAWAVETLSLPPSSPQSISSLSLSMNAPAWSHRYSKCFG